jgi:multiple sugar transport system substrate-binding protein
MTKVKFSFMSEDPNLTEAWTSALTSFEAQHRYSIETRTLSWEKAWAELVKVAVHRAGPDISEIGTTWTASFSSMEALRPFNEREVRSLGGSQAFLRSAWQTGSMQDAWGRQVTWAIPWITDTHVIYYRRDLLEKAGIDEASAFQTSEQLLDTIRRLQENGVAIPWVMSTVAATLTLHTLASWVWGAGGHFISPDGKRTRFGEPEARAGMYNYFRLHRYIPPPAQNLDDSQAGELFRRGEAAVTISGHWLLNAVHRHDANPDVAANLGIALSPGIPFVGGSNLAIWKHCIHTKAAIDLVRFLTGREAQAEHASQAGVLPARAEVLDMPPFTTSPHYRVIGKSLRAGRGFHAAYMWGLVEEKLIDALGKLWADIFADPDLDPEKAIASKMEPLAQQLDRTLSG